MTETVIVFFHTVITVENENVFPRAEEYPSTTFRNPNSRQLTGKIKNSYFHKWHFVYIHYLADISINHINQYLYI